MSLLLGIETSARDYRLALGDATDATVETAEEVSAARSTSLADMLRRALSRRDAEAGEIEAIAVDLGPGRLTSVRAGVAFANALGFSLSVPVLGFSVFELLAREADSDLPLLAVLPGPSGRTYVGLVQDGVLTKARLGTLPDVLDGLPRHVALAGGHRDRARERFPEAIDTGLDTPDPRTLLTRVGDARPPFAPVSPLNDDSEAFCR